MLFARPALPVDETRYLAVAWEMWWRGSIAVPYLNGDYYEGKPPLFFWLMQLGWWAAGVNEWWPRLIAPLFGLGSLALVRGLANRLWGARPAMDAAPPILLGSIWWAVFCASTMFDMLLGFFALWSVHAVIRVWQEGAARHFVSAGLALGLGILAKGPVVFLPALFVVAAAPWWSRRDTTQRMAWHRWYGGALGAAGIAALIALAWLVPLALSSGMAHLRNVAVGQTAGYVVESFSHRRPVWWYLPLLPLLLFPWSLWPTAWAALTRLKAQAHDPGVRLCLVWAAGVFVSFSLISGKQAHYLLLMFPAVALLLARLLPAADREHDRAMLVPGAVWIGTGAAIAAFPHLAIADAAAWIERMPAQAAYLAGAALAAIGIGVAASRRRMLATRVAVLSAASCATVLVLAWGIVRASSGAYDVRPLSAYLAGLEARGFPLAVPASYQGEFNFYGRLRSRVHRIAAAEAESWARAHPDGYLVAFYSGANWPPGNEPAPAFRTLYRGGGIAVWAARDLVRHPELADAFR
jgi:4-amino-4-deoxy-L-arabinose transferase-like glycosyltransferase